MLDTSPPIERLLVRVSPRARLLSFLYGTLCSQRAKESFIYWAFSVWALRNFNLFLVGKIICANHLDLSSSAVQRLPFNVSALLAFVNGLGQDLNVFDFLTTGVWTHWSRTSFLWKGLESLADRLASWWTFWLEKWRVVNFFMWIHC